MNETKEQGHTCVDCKLHDESMYYKGKNYYVVIDYIWEKFGAGEGMLCRPCLEKRFGQELKIWDFKDVPANYENGIIDDVTVFSLSDNNHKDVTEKLVILSEECSEVTKEVSKILRNGLYDINPKEGKRNKELLEEEIGDLLEMIEQVTVACGLDAKKMMSFKHDKRAKLEKWLKQKKV